MMSQLSGWRMTVEATNAKFVIKESESCRWRRRSLLTTLFRRIKTRRWKSLWMTTLDDGGGNGKHGQYS
jgi:hypothetical protein